ncbi:MAG: PEP-CTERM sorting domain-containing protein [Methylophilaceae bacterium]
MKQFLLPALFASLFMQAAPVLADSSASATINWGSFNVQIIDLSGGTNAPVFTWTNQSGAANSSASSYMDGGSDSASSSRSAPNWTKALTPNSNTENAQASGLRNTSTLSASAATQASSSDSYSWYSTNNASANANNAGNFSLTGYGIALISVSWNASVTGATSDLYDYSNANVSISGSYNDGLYSNGSANSGVNLQSYWGATSVNGLFTLAVTNAGSGLTTGYLNANVSTNSTSPFSVAITPVPEPDVYAMLLAGLGLIGFMSRRRLL